jgi:hypothetical protein
MRFDLHWLPKGGDSMRHWAVQGRRAYKRHGQAQGAHDRALAEAYYTASPERTMNANG